MSASFSGYERELKGILQGEEDALKRFRKIAKSVDRLELLKKLEERPFLVVRAAGSHGFDLVALRDRVVLPIEVKCSAQPRIPFTSASGRSQEQFVMLRHQTRRSGLPLLYAFRLLGAGESDPWKLFVAEPPVEDHNPFARRIAGHLPQVPSTASGNGVLRWEDGQSLLDFLDWVHSVLLDGG